ncbi:MAG TPA: acyl-CoA reductase, partial [Haliangium sp.]|nr:acyl-CoA reductase [Haliangium sp.]
MSRILHTPDGRRLAGHAVTPGQLATSLADLDQRVHALRSMGVRGRARAIAGLARWWLAACDAPPPAMAELLARGCAEAGLSIEMLRWGVREALGRWTEPELVALVERELGSVAALDHDQPGTMAVAPRLCLQVLARTVPPAGWQSVAMAWLAGAATLIRPSTHLVALIEAFALSLAEAAPELAAVTWVTRSDADDHAWHQALASHADAMVIHGGDDAVAAWQSVARRDALVVAHGHRVSAAFLSIAGLVEPALSENLRGLALDVCAWDQTGCLSPVTLYVEDGGPLTADQVAERLVADALPAIEVELPPGPAEPGAIAERTLFVRTRMLEARVHASRT